jgi:metal-responsive CopG/Arc/MetJ family transcriptional regulator
VKTAVSIPDPLFEAADRVARRRNMSRSALYAEALERLLADEQESDVTRRLDEVHAGTAADLDPVVVTLQAEALREDW